MKLREARASDIKAIAALHAASWRSAYRGVLSEAFLAGDILADRQRVWEQRIGGGAGPFVLVAETGDALLGFACCFLQNDAVWGSHLDNLHVAETAQGAGVGAALMRAVAERCVKDAPGTGLFLWVVWSNVRAQNFYNRLGGAETGSDVWTPPGGGAVPRLRMAWSAGGVSGLAGAVAGSTRQ